MDKEPWWGDMLVLWQFLPKIRLQLHPDSQLRQAMQSCLARISRIDGKYHLIEGRGLVQRPNDPFYLQFLEQIFDNLKMWRVKWG